MVDRWLYTYGKPSRIHSDQEKYSNDKIINNLCVIYGIKQPRTTPYNPWGNSTCKRFNRTLHDLLKNTTNIPEAHLACTSELFAICLQCVAKYYHNTTAISPDVWPQGTNALQ